MKRKRSAASETPVSSKPNPKLQRFPLTPANLRRLEWETCSMPSRAGSQSPTKRTASSGVTAPTSADADPIPRLRAYGIIVDSTELNAEVDEFARKICDTPRSITSPNAKRIAARAGVVERASEASGRRYLQDLLLLIPATPDADDNECIAKVWLAENSNLNRRFHPPVRKEFKDTGLLNQAVPDASIGYLTWQMANAASPAMDHAFSRDEDTMLRLEYPVDKESHLPFLTAQYKGVFNGTTVVHAKPQMARDGAILCHAMHCLLSDAHRPQKPSLTSTCHLSIACDMRTFAVYLHWCRPSQDPNENLEFHMRNLLDGMLKKERDVEDLRRAVRNWVDWALEDRLAIIKEALKEKSLANAVERQLESSETVPESPLHLPSPGITVPESQTTGEPSKKRRLDNSSG